MNAPKPLNEGADEGEDLIEISLGKFGGEPVFRGTRIPIKFLSQYLNHGYTVEDFLNEYPIDEELVRKVKEKIEDGSERGNRVPA